MHEGIASAPSPSNVPKRHDNSPGRARSELIAFRPTNSADERVRRVRPIYSGEAEGAGEGTGEREGHGERGRAIRVRVLAVVVLAEEAQRGAVGVLDGDVTLSAEWV